MPGWPPRRGARLLVPHGRQVLVPYAGAAGAAGIRPGGARVEDLGVPPLQGLAHSGPLGPELGDATAWVGGGHDRAVPVLVVGVPPPVLGPGREVLEAQDPGAQPHERTRAQTVLAHPRRSWGGGDPRVAGLYHQRSTAKPWCCRRCPESGGAGAACPRPRPQPRPHPRGPRAIGKNNWWHVA